MSNDMGYDNPPNTDPSIRVALAGNTTDDDGQALDDLFLANPMGAFGPNAGPVSSESAAYEKEEIVSPTRVLSRSVVIGTVNSVVQPPVQIMPADPNRKNLIITGTTAESIVVTSEKSDAYFGGSYLCTYGPLTLKGHTGAVWVYSTSVNPVTVNSWSVTV